MSFDLGPEPVDQLVQDRLPSDEYLDDIQQGLIPGGSEPRTMMEYEPTTDEMPDNRQLLIKTIHQDMEAAMNAQEDTPRSPERAPEPSIGFPPPTIQRIADAPMHSSPFQDAPTLRAHDAPALRAPRPRSTSVPPGPPTVAKMAKRYMLPQPSSRRVHHTTPARRWWRRGGIDPGEYGSAGVDTSLRSSTRDIAPRGPRLSRSSRHTPEGSGHHTQGAHRSCWPTRGPHTMGRSHTLPRWTVIHYMSLPNGTSNPVHSSS